MKTGFFPFLIASLLLVGCASLKIRHHPEISEIEFVNMNMPNPDLEKQGFNGDEMSDEDKKANAAAFDKAMKCLLILGLVGFGFAIMYANIAKSMLP